MAEEAPVRTRSGREPDDREQALRESGLLEEETAPFDRVTRLTRRLLGAETALISLVSSDRQTFKGQDTARSDLPESRSTPLDQSYCRFAVATGEPLVVNDARESPLLRGSPAIVELSAVAYAGIPLRLEASGEVFGTLCVLESKPREWSEEDLETLTELAGLARTELEYRVRTRFAEQVEQLALRLPEPVTRLGDAVRSTASMVDAPTDPRLPRTVDVARSRFQVVETISDDLARAAGAQRRTRHPVPTQVDLRERLQHAADLAGSTARPEDVVVRLPGEPVLVTSVRRDLDRALSLAAVTATHHARIGGTVELTLSLADGEATLRVLCPGSAVTVAAMLRVVAAFQPEAGVDALDVAVRSSGTRVRGPFAEAVATRDATTITAKFSTVREPQAAAGTEDTAGTAGAREPADDGKRGVE